MSEEFGALDALLADPSTSAVLTDFDGTLAPIVPNPEEARPLPRAVEVLESLSRLFAVVGVVSGRPASFLASALLRAGPSVHLVGVYGLEWVENGAIRRAPEVEPWVAAAREVLEAARAEAPPGIGIEDKGASVTIHWRAAPHAGKWAQPFARSWSQRTGLRLQHGRMAVEFRPPVSIDKGSVVERLAGGSTAACFAGDDAGDIAAFEALDKLRARGVRTVKMAVSDEESPPGLAAAADLVVDGPQGALEALSELASCAASSTR
jgi:trehalose 6-phosphate phosphatase